MNYYTAHPNKRPKTLRLRRKANPLLPMMAMIGAIGASQMAMVKSQIGGSKEDRQKQVLLTALNTSGAILSETRNERLRQFKKTGKYGRGAIYNPAKMNEAINLITAL